jgi:predicted Zn finger-like uncharacterized protein
VNYRTTCPQCASVFRLGANQLDAAQGWVQCSVCGAAFDARQSLLMEDGTPLPPAPEPIEAPPLPDTAADGREEEFAAAPAAPDEAMSEIVSPAESAPVAEVPRGVTQRDSSLELPSIILIDPELPAPDDLGPLPRFHTVSTYPPAPAAPAAYAPVVAAAPLPAAPTARIEYAAALPGAARIPAARSRIGPRAWGAASALLLLLLLAQLTYFLRDTLVSRLPQTRPAFEQACAVLGCKLSLPKNLALLQIVGSDLQTESRGRLRLALTLGNRASHAQAWPVLLLTLTDERNRPLARRSFAPSEYLGDPGRIAAGMPPRSEQALSLPLTVRDLAPMGFDLQLTY